jgi:hypothetical protein
MARQRKVEMSGLGHLERSASKVSARDNREAGLGRRLDGTHWLRFRGRYDLGASSAQTTDPIAGQATGDGRSNVQVWSEATLRFDAY